MRNSVAIATFIVAGAGAIGTGALTLSGSDTLFNVTLDMITSTSNPASPLCIAASVGGLSFSGGGSGLGERAMYRGEQHVAPMSRFLGNNICTVSAANGSPTTAAGIVVGLDGLSIVGSAANAGTAACNGAAVTGTPTDCSVAGGVPIDTTVGEASNTVIPLSDGTTYTLAGWRDALKILYMGGPLTNDTTASHAGCAGLVRRALADHWGQFFENPSGCTGAAGDVTGPCTQIRHIFRLDDASGTTAVLSELLGFGDPSATDGMIVSAAVATALGIPAWHLGTDKFCNDTANLPAPYNTTYPGENPGQENTTSGIVPNDARDRDPIRRTCVGGRTHEDVCERATYNPAIPSCSVDSDCKDASYTCQGGTCWTKTGSSSLGLLLPIVSANTLGATQYPAAKCDGPAIKVKAPIIQLIHGTKPGLCPNGDDANNSGGLCTVPATLAGNPNCLAVVGQTSGSQSGAVGSGQAGTGKGPDPNAVDARVFNLWAWTLPPGASFYQPAVDDAGRPIIGSAYWRLHESHTLATRAENAVPCTKPDATDQIGCLVQASPCSLGYAGREAAAQSGAVAIKVQGMPPADICVQEFKYPLSRKLYLNSISGFATGSGITAAEQALATCETTTATINNALAFNNFVPLPSTGPNAVNGGQPFCEDFNEEMIQEFDAFGDLIGCGTSPNIDGCAADNAALGLPNTRTTCGNGVLEAFEDCDDGAFGTTSQRPGTNGNGFGSTHTCSLTCRLNR